MAFQLLGYESAHHGQGQWNGVAILSKIGLEDVVMGFGDADEPDPDARVIWATCNGVRIASVYVPNGREVGHEHYEYKLRWLERLRRRIEDAEDPTRPIAVSGDWNIAPDDRDVYDPAMYVGATHVSDPERKALQAIEAWGLHDVFREHYDVGGLFSWWDYRAGNFHKGKGMRIDLVLASRSLADTATAVLIDRNARKGKGPSDHAPLIVDFDL
jgi:exodeoxyribonuclease-3